MTLAPTATALASPTNPSVTGQSVTYTAVVSYNTSYGPTPTGTVEFEDGGVSISGCTAQTVSAGSSATCTTALATAGPHTITATYSGDANFVGSTSAALTQIVNQDPTTTTVTSSANPSVTGQSVTYTAAVTANSPGSGTPTGTVDFTDGSTTICSGVSLSATATATCTAAPATAGTHTITATYSGDSNFTGSSGRLTQTVNQDVTTTSVSADLNPAITGQSVTYTATVTANSPGSGTPTGTVDFTDGSTTICSGVSLSATATATCTAAPATAGTHTITATYSGDSNFSSSSGSLSETVNQDPTFTDLQSSANPSVTGQSVTYTATVSVVEVGLGPITPTGTVEFEDGGTGISGCKAQPLSSTSSTAASATSSATAPAPFAVILHLTATCTVTYTATGPHSISATYSGDSNFIGSTSATLTQNVDTNLSTYLTSNGTYDLTSANLKGAYMVGADLAGANITSANLSGANLKGANLTSANLSGANFSSANLENADLEGADLTSANFKDATLSGVNLTDANLTTTNFKGATGMDTATLTGATWSFTNCPDNTDSNIDGGTCLNNLTP